MSECKHKLMSNGFCQYCGLSCSHIIELLEEKVIRYLNTAERQIERTINKDAEIARLRAEVERLTDENNSLRWAEDRIEILKGVKG